MTRDLFPERMETERLAFERMSQKRTDPFEFYELVTRDDWRGDATEHMPWFRLDTLGDVGEFLDVVDAQWANRERARYLLRSRDAGGELVGTTAFVPEWDARRAGSDVVLAREYWGRGYGGERAAVFVELAFDAYDLDAYYTTCAAGNEPSKRMIEKYIERYGGRHEGLLRQHSERPDGSVTDQHRFSITREEYEEATRDVETLDFEIEW